MVTLTLRYIARYSLVLSLGMLAVWATAHAESIPVSSYGSIIKKQINAIKGAQVETVELLAQHSGGSEKKIKRKGILVKYPNAKATVLICHGFMCDKFDTGFLRNIFSGGKFNTMSFDFRGHGDDKEGQRCTFGRDEAYDVIAAARFLRSHPDLKYKPVYVYGFSMGAVSAIEAQAKDGSLFDAMVLDCPFDSSENIIKKNLNNIKFSLFGYQFNMPGRSLLTRYAFHPYIQSLVTAMLRAVTKIEPSKVDVHICPVHPAESIKMVSAPCFFIHCKNDEKVSVTQVKNVFDSAASDHKKLWVTNGRRHYDSYFYNPEKYTDEVRGFLDLALKGKLSTEKNEVIEDREEV